MCGNNVLYATAELGLLFALNGLHIWAKEIFLWISALAFVICLLLLEMFWKVKNTEAGFWKEKTKIYKYVNVLKQ